MRRQLQELRAVGSASAHAAAFAAIVAMQAAQGAVATCRETAFVTARASGLFPETESGQWQVPMRVDPDYW
jgi:hypothetical protein